MRRILTPLLLGVGFFAFTLVEAGVVSAQVGTGKVTGVVTDAQTGEPLVGVQVYIEDTGRGALTGDNGRYFIVNVTPGAYTVVAELIGYQTFRRENLGIVVDQTVVANFELTPQAIAVEEIRVVAEQTPLIRVEATGTRRTTTSADLEALPVSSVEEALTLQQGFLVVPENTNILSFDDTRRGAEPVRIRGGRAGETLTLIDGIPVNNFIFGGPALSITRKAVSQVDFIRGGFPPQYGNALSGIINIVTREGGEELEGALEYQTTELAGALGSTQDDLENYDFFEGFVSGPVPGTEWGMGSERLRFMVAGRQEGGADRVLEFDDDVFDPADRGRPTANIQRPATWDVFPGWRAFGFDQRRDLFGKLTLFFSPTSKLSLSVLDYERQNQAFDFEFLRTYTQPLDAPIINSPGDSIFAFGANESNFDITQTSFTQNRTLFSAKLDQTFSRTAVSVVGGAFLQDVTSCNFFFGFCLRDAFDDPNFDDNRFLRGGVSNFTPAEATDHFGFGGEDMKTYILRGDIQSQVTDHHNLQGGIQYEKHDLDFVRVRDFGVNEVIAVSQNYFAEPFNAALYLQDKIEYDFITVELGFRVDWGKAGGLFFADPLDPTNGTNAFDVCTNPDNFGPVTHPATGERFEPNPNWTLGTCSGAIRDSATVIAFGDDLTESQTRTQFSPRLGVSFPLTARSSVFFNFSRLSQNPLFNNIYQNTGIGTAGEGIPCGFAPVGAETRNGCGPIIAARTFGTSFLGNPNLLIESTTTYEIGYLAELFDDYALSAIMFSKDQFGLTGLREAIGISDPGATYLSSTPNYRVLVNQDFQTVRGFEITLQRRVTNFWGFDLSYGYSQARTNASPPEREFQNQAQNALPQVNREVISDVDIPHRFVGVMHFRAGEEAPEINLGDVNLGSALKHTRLAITLEAQSGFPYTPVRGFEEATNFNTRLFRNAARGPGIWSVDLRAEKNFRIGNLLYGGFLRVDNVFDTKNCIQPFETTGRCDSGTIDQTRARQGNATDPNQVNTTFFDRPHIFGPRRRIAAGIRVSF